MPTTYGLSLTTTFQNTGGSIQPGSSTDSGALDEISASDTVMFLAISATFGDTTTNQTSPSHSTAPRFNLYIDWLSNSTGSPPPMAKAWRRYKIFRYDARALPTLATNSTQLWTERTGLVVVPAVSRYFRLLAVVTHDFIPQITPTWAGLAGVQK